jgi:hypothetical protein
MLLKDAEGDQAHRPRLGESPYKCRTGLKSDFVSAWTFPGKALRVRITRVRTGPSHTFRFSSFVSVFQDPYQSYPKSSHQHDRAERVFGRHHISINQYQITPKCCKLCHTTCCLSHPGKARVSDNISFHFSILSRKIKTRVLCNCQHFPSAPMTKREGLVTPQSRLRDHL